MNTKYTQEKPLITKLTPSTMFRNKVITFGIIIAIIVVFITGCGGTASIAVETGPYDNIAKCLAEKGATLYYAEWCPHCKNQKESFGTSLQFIKLVDCEKEKEVCNEKGIRGYPTWIIDGEQYPGARPPETLGEMFNCQV